MKKKILFLIMPLLLMANFAQAYFSYYYCTASGQLWHIIIGPDNNVAQYPAGGCAGGPWGFGGYSGPLSPTEGENSGYSEASETDYTHLGTLDFEGYSDPDKWKDDSVDIANFLGDSTDIYNLTQVPPVWMDPDKVPLNVSEYYATQAGQTIYALTIKENPVDVTVHFDLWSVKDQEITFRVIDISTNDILYSTEKDLSEGKNSNISVTIPNTIDNGTYLMSLITEANEIKSSLIVYQKP